MLRPARRDCDRSHRQRARVRREERVRRRLPVERAEDRPLEVEVLERCLDRDVGRRGDRVERQRGPQVREPPVDPLVDRIRVELELRCPPSEADTDPLHACLERLFVDVVEDDFVARFERDLGDPGAHRPGADDADDGAGEVVRPVWLVHGFTVRQRAVRPLMSITSTASSVRAGSEFVEAIDGRAGFGSGVAVDVSDNRAIEGLARMCRQVDNAGGALDSLKASNGWRQERQ